MAYAPGRHSDDDAAPDDHGGGRIPPSSLVCSNMRIRRKQGWLASIFNARPFSWENAMCVVLRIYPPPHPFFINPYGIEDW